MPDYVEFTQAVRDLARREILSRFNRYAHAVDEQVKSDGSIVTEVDLMMQQQLSQLVPVHLPDTVLLGEEMPAEQQQNLMSSERVCCVDPLDGTGNFAAGIPFFSVSMCVLENKEIVFGLVYDPVRDEMFTVEKGRGVWLNGQKLPKPQREKPLPQAMALIDFKRLPPILSTRLAVDPRYRSQRSFGSVALDWCWLVAGRGDVYIHGRQNLWDFGAGYLMLSEMGGCCCQLDGSGVFSGELKPASVIATMTPVLFAQWREYCQLE